MEVLQVKSKLLTAQAFRPLPPCFTQTGGLAQQLGGCTQGGPSCACGTYGDMPCKCQCSKWLAPRDRVQQVAGSTRPSAASGWLHETECSITGATASQPGPVPWALARVVPSVFGIYAYAIRSIYILTFASTLQYFEGYAKSIYACANTLYIRNIWSNKYALALP
jgi:hypothetical protein